MITLTHHAYAHVYCMVGNFHKGFIFTFFTSREQFVKIKTTIFFAHEEQMMFQGSTTVNFLDWGPNFNRSLSVSMLLTAIAQANLEIKDTGTVSAEADKWTGRWRQIAFILSLFNPGTKSWDYCCFWNNSGHVVQLVAVELPNMRVPESLTAKIKTVKIWNTNFGPFCENLFYQLYGIKSRHYWGTSSSHFHSSLLECCWRIRWCCHAELPLTTSCV